MQYPLKYTLQEAGQYIHPLPPHPYQKLWGVGMMVLKNTSFAFDDSPATITISEGDQAWEEAYRRWLDMMTPTDSPEWKKGVCLSYI